MIVWFIVMCAIEENIKAVIDEFITHSNIGRLPVFQKCNTTLHSSSKREIQNVTTTVKKNRRIERATKNQMANA